MLWCSMRSRTEGPLMKTLLRFRILAIVGLLLSPGIAIVPLASAAQTGGVPALADQVQTLQVQVQTLMTTIVTLQTANDNFQAALNAEKAARIAGDTALQTALSKETADRMSADQGLQAAILFGFSVETNDVANLHADVTHLQSEIDNLGASNVGDVFVGQGGASGDLNNNSPTTVASVTVPAGTYLIHAAVPVVNLDGSEQSGECALSTDPGAFKGNSSGADAFIFQMPSFTGEQLPLIDAKTFAVDTTVTVRCTGFKWNVFGAAIKALRIRSIH